MASVLQAAGVAAPLLLGGPGGGGALPAPGGPLLLGAPAQAPTTRPPMVMACVPR